MDILHDNRSNCYSVMTTLSVGEYIQFIYKVYPYKGGIEGQRDALKTKTAIRIRETMRQDFSRGAVLPPIVVGVIVDEARFTALPHKTQGDFLKVVKELESDGLSIIDGMQRTTAIIESFMYIIKDLPSVPIDEVIASKKEPAIRSFLDRAIRIEFWVAHDINSLIYRMMILNTGQVPWNLKRQIEVVFRALLKEIGDNLGNTEVLSIADGRKRTKPGQYRADDLVELYLVFGTRKSTIDTKERLADEFTRMDFIEATSNSEFTEQFFDILQLLVNLDHAFGRYSGDSGSEKTERFCAGKDIFSSQPARAGFIAASAVKIFGRPGINKSAEEQKGEINSLNEIVAEVIGKLNDMSNEQLGKYLDFETLNQIIERKSSRVGEYERNVFESAFTVFFEEGERLDDLGACWRAY